MLISEIHVQLLQRLQEVGSYKRDKYRSEEIDLALNKAMYRLLEAGVATSFEGDQINLAHVAALIHKNKISEVIQPEDTDKLFEDNITNCYSVIPSDLYWIVNGRAEVITDPLNCEEAPDLELTNYSEYVAVVPFPALGSSPYFANTSIASSVLGTIYTSPTAYAAGFNSTTAKYAIVNNILDTLYRKYATLQVYWERYRDVHYTDSLIFVGSTDIGTMTLTSNAQTSIVARTVNSYDIFNRAEIDDLDSQETTSAPIKINRENYLYQGLQNSLYKTRETRPIVDQTGDYFIIYTSENFIVTRLAYDYIRKPKTISLVLNQTCELSPTLHNKLIDIAVEILRLDIKDPSYPLTVQDTQNRTI
jgi:hypothetical protein